VVLVDKSQNNSFRVEGHDRGDDSTILCNIIFYQFNWLFLLRLHGCRVRFASLKCNLMIGCGTRIIEVCLFEASFE
jgi:hypothetical protein